MTTEKICFRYDGSEEAKKCIEWINETHYKKIAGAKEFYHNTQDDYACFGSFSIRDSRLVTPAEFLRLVKGEYEWTPKYGEEVAIQSCLSTQPQTGIIKTSFKTDSGDAMYVVQVGEDSWRITPTVRPVRKSVREELIEIIESCSCSVAKADEILSKFNVTLKDNP